MGPMGESRSRNGREEIELGGGTPKSRGYFPGLSFVAAIHLLGLVTLFGVGCTGDFLAGSNAPGRACCNFKSGGRA